VTLAQNEWLDDGALTDAEKALIQQGSRELEAHLHSSVSREEAKNPLMAPLRR
jgi:hypothetical protein